jgi:hypothetical protein
VDLLGLQGAQARVNTLEDPDAQRWAELGQPEELGGRGLGRRGLVDGNRPAQEQQFFRGEG